MSWGVDVQPYYRKGRQVTRIMRSEIDMVCDCGYITLKPNTDIEARSGGLTVKRSQVTVIDDNTGLVVKSLRPRGKEFTHVWSCNACINDWK